MELKNKEYNLIATEYDGIEYDSINFTQNDTRNCVLNLSTPFEVDELLILVTKPSGLEITDRFPKIDDTNMNFRIELPSYLIDEVGTYKATIQAYGCDYDRRTVGEFKYKAGKEIIPSESDVQDKVPILTTLIGEVNDLKHDIENGITGGAFKGDDRVEVSDTEPTEETIEVWLDTSEGESIDEVATKSDIDYINSSLDNIVNKNNNGLFTDISNKYRGASIYIPYREDLDGSFAYNVDKSFEANCNTISICPIFWMNDKTGNIVGYKGSLTKEEILNKCKYVKNKGMKVLLKPHVGCDGIGSHGDIIPSDVNAWTDSYTNQLIDLVNYCKDYIDIVSISNEINGQSKFNYAKWKTCIDSIRNVNSSFILTNANTITELRTNVFLKDLDVLGCNMYVGVVGDLSTNQEKQRTSLFSTSSYLNELFAKGRELNKPIIITEVGILPFERSLSQPEAWGFTDNPPLNYNAQVRYYKLAIREYINANDIIGVMVWNACDGYTFVNRPCEYTLKQIFGGEINV